MYSSTYNSWRFSRLDQINTQNVKNLQVKWLFQGRHQEKFETTPLVVDGIMYLTRPENDVYALDAETGRVMWTYSHKNPGANLQLLRQGESRPGDPGQPPVHGHARHAPDRHRRQVGPRVVEDRDVRLHRVRRIRGHRRAARGQGQSDHRNGRRRAFHLGLSRCLRCRHRQAASGGSTPSRSPARRISEPGPATPGRPAASPPGTTAPTIPRPTPSTGAPAIRGRTTTATSARATISIPAPWWRSTPTPAS